MNWGYWAQSRIFSLEPCSTLYRGICGEGQALAGLRGGKGGCETKGGNQMDDQAQQGNGSQGCVRAVMRRMQAKRVAVRAVMRIKVHLDHVNSSTQHRGHSHQCIMPEQNLAST
eukprot:1133671-Pelagomonas_calceolata.AAC.15